MTLALLRTYMSVQKFSCFLLSLKCKQLPITEHLCADSINLSELVTFYLDDEQLN